MPLTNSDIHSVLLIKRAVALVMLITLVSPAALAQRRQPRKTTSAESQTPQQNVAFENLLAADSYNVYGEVRGVGQLIRSEGVKDLLDPITKLTAPPKEFKSLIKWLNTRADSLTTSRLLFAAWPARPKLPQALVAIEFPSVAEAEKFEPQLKDLLPKILPGKDSGSSPVPVPTPSETGGAKPGAKPSPPPYILKQVGTLVFISDIPFSFKDLKPPGSKLLSEDQNFRTAHERFTSESVFLYFDLAKLDREDRERQRQLEEQQQQGFEESSKQPKVKEDNIPAPPEASPQESPTETTPDNPQASPEPTSSTQSTLTVVEVQPPQDAKSKELEAMDQALGTLSRAFFSGQPRWPEAIGAGLVFEGDSYVARVLLINKGEARVGLIPFLPQLISGPALTPESPSILPADTELFVSASLDFSQIYEGVVRAAHDQLEVTERNEQTAGRNPELTSPYESYEKQLGLKIKDDLLPLLGNEVAFTIPVKVLEVGPPTAPSAAPAENGNKEAAAAPTGPNPIFAISIKDRQAVRALLARLIDSMGLKGISRLAQTEKRDDTELVSFGNAFGYAFVGNFLVFSPDVKATRHVVDSYLNHETLSSSIQFRNYTRWQPRLVLGQIYLSPALMESYNSFAASTQISDQLRDFLMLLSPIAQPVTYAVSNEGAGPLHELHLPKNLLLMMIAGMSIESNESPETRNEMSARTTLRTIASAELAFQATDGGGHFGTIDELIKAGLIPKELMLNDAYKIELTASGTRFEITAVPSEYGKTGKLSFFVDESSVLRAGDHGGGPATVADRPGE